MKEKSPIISNKNGGCHPSARHIYVNSLERIATLVYELS